MIKKSIHSNTQITTYQITKSLGLICMLLIGHLFASGARTLTISELDTTRVHYQFGQGTVLDPNLILDTDGNSVEKVEVEIISNAQTGDFLELDTTAATAAGFKTSGIWNNTSKILTVEKNAGNGTEAEFQAILRTVAFRSTHNSQNTPPRVVAFTILEPDRYYTVDGTYHFYEFISGIIVWQTARDEALTRYYYGKQGYLATITSAGENSFIATHPEIDGNNGWLGGTDEAVEGTWRWASGPEAGRQFSNGATSTAPDSYVNWNGGEPNNSGNEDYLQMRSPGNWNDLRATSNNPTGYVIEYGGLNDSAIQVTVNIVNQNGPFQGNNF